MNEPIAPIAPVETIASDYKDRSTGLTVFGILTLLLGCVCALFVPLMLLGQLAAAKTQQGSPNMAAMLPGMLMYGGLAVALIWLGIGSIKARRWARALLLIFSWCWLVMGAFVMIFMGFLLPRVLEGVSSAGASNGTTNHALPPGTVGVMMIVMFGIFSIIFVLLPAVWIYFYKSRHVKATCEARDPVMRWTDACPLPVLASCVWAMFSVPMMLLMPLAAHGVVPFFGIFLTGMAGTAIYLLIAAIWAYAAWLMYQLKPLGWWLLLVVMGLFLVSSLMTYARHDVLEMYQLMGYPQAQIDQMQKMGLMSGNRMGWVTALSVLPWLGYLIFIKKYFRGKDQV